MLWGVGSWTRIHPDSTGMVEDSEMVASVADLGEGLWGEGEEDPLCVAAEEGSLPEMALHEEAQVMAVEVGASPEEEEVED